MRVKPQIQIPRTVALRTIKVGQCALKTGGAWNDSMSSKQYLIMRVKPCNVHADGDAVVERRDVLVTNLQTGNCWYTDGDQQVIPVDAEANYEVQP